MILNQHIFQMGTRCTLLHELYIISSGVATAPQNRTGSECVWPQYCTSAPASSVCHHNVFSSKICRLTINSQNVSRPCIAGPGPVWLLGPNYSGPRYYMKVFSYPLYIYFTPTVNNVRTFEMRWASFNDNAAHRDEGRFWRIKKRDGSGPKNGNTSSRIRIRVSTIKEKNAQSWKIRLYFFRLVYCALKLQGYALRMIGRACTLSTLSIYILVVYIFSALYIISTGKLNH